MLILFLKSLNSVTRLQCDEELLATLLLEGFDLNCPARDGLTPLYLACELGHVNIVK